MKRICAIVSALLMLYAFFGESIAMAEQVTRSHPGCTGGGKEAEVLFTLGRDHSKGMNGMAYDRERAVRFYRESFELGNPKAGINLGLFLRTAFSSQLDTEKERFDQMNSYFQKVIDMGCPDGYAHLAYSYQEGWGVPRSIAKSRELIKKGLEAGSYACMAGWGMILDYDKKPEEAKVWLQRALDGGYGAAADTLCRIYFREDDLEKEIQVLRQAARLGDYSSLIGLSMLYENGRRQPKDLEYAACFITIARTIDTRLPPPIIDNLDELCPPRPVVPYTQSETE
jgi:TPR repeat protein